MRAHRREAQRTRYIDGALRELSRRARAAAKDPAQTEEARSRRGSGLARAARRLQAGPDHRAHATQERREPHRHGRGDRLAAAHHARGPDRPASEGLRDRARQEPARQDGLPPAGSGALKPDPIRVEIARLGDLDLDALRLRWRKLFRASAPAHLTRSLLLRIIAYRIQANAYGDLDRATLRFLDKIARAHEARRASGETRRAVPAIPPVDQRRSLKPGTELMREHAGTMHRVVVIEDGFSWNGATYRSLSEVARAITGTNWNGPRFFGLRDRPQAARPRP